MKWAVKSTRPGRIAEYLQATGWMVYFRKSKAFSACRRTRNGIRKAMWACIPCMWSTRPRALRGGMGLQPTTARCCCLLR